MAMTLITTNTDTPGSVTDSAFTGIDNTYKLYIFKFINVNPGTDMTHLTFNGSDDTSSHSYDINKTTTWFKADGSEDGNVGNIAGHQSQTVADSTNYAQLSSYAGSASDECLGGDFFLFNPSSTTYVKHFYSTCQFYSEQDPSQRACNAYTAGYFNTTAAITAINFKMSSGDFTGIINLYVVV